MRGYINIAVTPLVPTPSDIYIYIYIYIYTHTHISLSMYINRHFYVCGIDVLVKELLLGLGSLCLLLIGPIHVTYINILY